VFRLENLIEQIHSRISEIVTIVFFSSISFVIYLLAKDEPVKKRLRGALLGFFISLAFSYPAFLFLGDGKWWALAAISSCLTISGQFIPEMIEDLFKKYVHKKFGVKKDD
jgi:hypothetical protein